MKRKQNLPELLAPAGSKEALIAAIAGGADAVYVGGKRFGARAYAKNFTNEELNEAVTLCHIHGVRIYVTLNTLILDKEIDEAVEYAHTLYKMGVDALIVADLGVISKIKKEVPGLELHASTQMGVHNSEGVDFAASLGCSRVVLARECSGENIKNIVEKSSAECEVFLHGALCVCHSGQCLFSSLVGGRSGNRGECAQPCRLPYNGGKYPLSLNDLSLSSHINELIDSGVSSLKIEGRMKSADYVYKVTKVYRTLLDERRNSNSKEKKTLLDAFSRGGFTDGYFTGKTFEKMTGIRSEEDKIATKNSEEASVALDKLRIKAKAVFKSGEPSSLTFYASAASAWDNRGGGETKVKEISVNSFGEVPSAAQNAPLTNESLKARLSKLGNTPFKMESEDIDLVLDDGINLSPSAINALRRDASEKLIEAFSYPVSSLVNDEYSSDTEGEKKRFDNLLNICSDSSYETPKNTALFFDAQALIEIGRKNPRLLSNIDVAFVPLYQYENANKELQNINIGIYLPPIIMENEVEEVKREIKKCESLGASFALVGNISHFAFLKESSLSAISDFRLNVTNKYSNSLIKKMGAKSVILSPELTLPAARDIGGAVITLGRIPLMITERCFTKENFGCSKCNKAFFVDRKGIKFPLMREYNHRNIIFNSAPTYMGDKKDELKSAKIKAIHFIFSSESKEEIENLLVSYKNEKPFNAPHRRIGRR